MNEYRSGSSLQEARLSNFFLPPYLAWILYALISLIMLILLNIPALWQVVLGQSVSSIHARDIAPLTDKFSAFQDRLSTSTVMLFWASIGAITYIIVWLLENVIFITRKEVDESHYLRSGSSPQKNYWESAIASNVSLIFITLLWLCFVAIYLRVILPVFSDLFHSGLYSPPLYKRFLDIAVSVLGNTLAIYVFLLIQRLLTYSWRANRA